MNSCGSLWVVAGHGDLAFLHRLQQGRLHLRRRAVDLVGEHQVAEDRARLELELTLASLRVVHLAAGDVRGQQVGRELDAAELALDVLRKRLDRPGLGQPGQSLHQHVAVGEDGNQKVVDHLPLADDALADPGAELVDGFAGLHDPFSSRVSAWSKKQGRTRLEQMRPREFIGNGVSCRCPWRRQ
jgi:hypothetical protein